MYCSESDLNAGSSALGSSVTAAARTSTWHKKPASAPGKAARAVAAVGAQQRRCGL